MKNEALAQLKQLALVESQKRHPDLPMSARYVKTYSDRTANELQRAITDFLVFSGFQCERVSISGRFIDNRKTVKDTLGFTRVIGSGKWISSSMQKGSADLSATINGMSVKIEVKIGRDKQSEFQKKYQEQIEQAGGIYVIIRSFSEFLNFYYKQFNNQTNDKFK